MHRQQANTLTTAGLSVLNVAQSFRLETFSDVAFQTLGDDGDGVFFGRLVVIWMAQQKVE